jgi:hypothetical protein
MEAIDKRADLNKQRYAGVYRRDVTALVATLLLAVDAFTAR